MDDLTITSIIAQLVEMGKSVMAYASQLDGRSGFILGALTWWLVESATRHFAAVIRWTVLIGVLGGGAALVGSNLELVSDITQGNQPNETVTDLDLNSDITGLEDNEENSETTVGQLAQQIIDSLFGASNSKVDSNANDPDQSQGSEDRESEQESDSDDSDSPKREARGKSH